MFGGKFADPMGTRYLRPALCSPCSPTVISNKTYHETATSITVSIRNECRVNANRLHSNHRNESHEHPFDVVAPACLRDACTIVRSRIGPVGAEGWSLDCTRFLGELS